MIQYGLVGLYSRPYGASTPAGTKPTGRPWSCWESDGAGQWRLTAECRLNEKTTTSPTGAKTTTYQNRNLVEEPYIELRPDDTSGNAGWKPNYPVLERFRTGLSLSERGSAWGRATENARLRAIIGAYSVIPAADVKALNALTKEYVPDYSTVYDLVKTLTGLTGPAGANAPNLWYQWVVGDLAVKRSVIQQMGAKVRVSRGQSPTPPSQRTREVPVVEVDTGTPIGTYLVGGLLLAGLAGGAYYFLRG
jgi:hypothetical protein